MLSRQYTSVFLPPAKLLFLIVIIFPPGALATQESDADKNLPGPARPEQIDKARSGPSAKDAIPFKDLPGRILGDQKFLWVRPFRLRHDDAPWVAGILVPTAGLIATDGRVGQELSESPPGGGYSFARRIGQAGSGLTDFGVAGVFYLVGRRRGDEHARATGLLGLEAVADATIVVEILKAATERPRPTSSGGRLRNHNADGEFFAGGNSFPSGHAAEAWALAATLSERYPDRRWMAPTVYGLAGLISASRLVERRHFPSDVFVGSVLGYLIGRHVSHAAGQEPPCPIRRLKLLPDATPNGRTALTLTWQF